MDGFTTLLLDNGKGNSEEVDAFYCNYTNQWHQKDKYISEPWANSWCLEEYIKNGTIQ